MLYIFIIYPLQYSTVLAYLEYLDFRNLILMRRDTISLEAYMFQFFK